MTRKKKSASGGRTQRHSVLAGGENSKKTPLVIEFVFNRPAKHDEHGAPANQAGAQAVPEGPERVIFDFRE